MSSRRADREVARVVFATGLSSHITSRPGGSKTQGPRKPKAGRKRPRGGERPELGKSKAQPGSAGEVQTGSEPVAGWVTRREAQALLGVDHSKLADVLDGYKLSRRWVEVYCKAEILALRKKVEKLR